MIRKVYLQICILAALVLLLLGTSSAQSLGDVARSSKASRKTGRVITNDNLPEASGPANGAAIRPDTKDSADDTAASGPGKDQKAAKASPANDQDAAQKEKQLRDEIRTVNARIHDYDSRLESETNEATRAGMQNMINDYEKMRQTSQQQLDELTAAKNKEKGAK